MSVVLLLVKQELQVVAHIAEQFDDGRRLAVLDHELRVVTVVVDMADERHLGNLLKFFLVGELGGEQVFQVNQQQGGKRLQRHG